MNNLVKYNPITTAESTVIRLKRFYVVDVNPEQNRVLADQLYLMRNESLKLILISVQDTISRSWVIKVLKFPD